MEGQAVFGRRGVRPVPVARAAAPVAAEPSAAYLELAAAARSTFRQPDRASEDRAEEVSAQPRLAAGETQEDADMRAYIGPRWRAYEPVWRKVKASPGLNAGRSVAAAIFGPVWLLYRRQYLLGLGLFGVQYASAAYAFGWSAIFEIAAAGFFVRYGKSIVVLAGQSKIREIAKRGLTPEGERERIAAAGGVDPLAAMLGLFAVGALIFWNLSAAEHEYIPEIGALGSLSTLFRH